MGVLRAGGPGGGGLAVSRLQGGPQLGSSVVPNPYRNATRLLPDFGDTAGGAAGTYTTDLTVLSSLPAGLSLAQAGSTYYVNSSGQFAVATANTPRFTYEWDSGTSAFVQAGIAVEGSAATQWVFDQRLNQSNWIKTNTSAATTTGPDNVSTSGYTLTSTVAGVQNSATINVATTQLSTDSVCVKAGTGSNYAWLASEVGGATGMVAAWFNLTTGQWTGTTVRGSTAPTIAKFYPPVKLANGWWWIAYETATNAGPYLTVGFSDADGVMGATIGNSCSFSFPQKEAPGKWSFPIAAVSPFTGYVTRAADALTASGSLATILAGAAASIVIGTRLRSIGTNGRLLGDTAGTEGIYVASDTSAGIQGASTSQTATLGGSGVYTDTKALTGASWSGSAGSIVADNGTVGTNASGMTISSGAYFFRDSTGTNAVYGYLRSISAWNSRLTDADLATATSLGGGPATYNDSVTISFANAVSPTGLIDMAPSVTLPATLASVDAGSIVADALASLAVATVIGTAGSGLSYTNTATINVSPAIDTTTGTNRVSTPTATINFSPVITPAGIDLMTASAALAVATAITPAGSLLLSGSTTLSVATAINSTTGTNRISFPTAALAVTMAVAAVGGLSFTSTATISLTTSLSSSVPSFSPTSAAALALVSGISPTGLLNMNALASNGVNSGIGPNGTFSANLSGLLAVSSVISTAGNYSAILSAALAAATAISAAPGLVVTKTATLALTAGVSGSSVLSAFPAASLPATLGIASLGALIATAAASLAVVTDEQATTGGALYTGTATLAVSPVITASVKASMAAAAAVAVSSGISASSIETILAAAALALTSTSAPAATEIMNASASLSGSFAEQAVVTAREFSDAIAFAATAVLASTGRLTAAGIASVSANIGQLMQSAAFMQAATSLASSLAAGIAGTLSILQSMTVSATAGTSASGRTTVSGSIGFGATAASALNVNLGAAGQLSFTATYNAEPANVLTASNAITIAAHLAIGVALSAEKPLTELLSVNGIWQGRFDLAGIYADTAPLSGSVELTVRLDGVLDQRPALEGVVQTTERLTGRV